MREGSLWIENGKKSKKKNKGNNKNSLKCSHIHGLKTKNYKKTELHSETENKQRISIFLVP